MNRYDLIENPEEQKIKSFGIYAYVSAERREEIQNQTPEARKRQEEALRKEVNKLRMAKRLLEL